MNSLVSSYELSTLNAPGVLFFTIDIALEAPVLCNSILTVIHGCELILNVSGDAVITVDVQSVTLKTLLGAYLSATCDSDRTTSYILEPDEVVNTLAADFVQGETRLAPFAPLDITTLSGADCDIFLSQTSSCNVISQVAVLIEASAAF